MTTQQPAVYILASRRNGTLYIGVTSQLPQRIWQHRNDVIEGFTKRYKIHLLVYYEACPDMRAAIIREKQLKNMNRADKLQLIERHNRTWRDLYRDIL